jgi:hypothetical protein
MIGLYPYVDIYYFSKFPQWEIGLGSACPKLYIAFPNIFYFLVVLREHNSAPKWSICAIKFEVVMVVIKIKV